MPAPCDAVSVSYCQQSVTWLNVALFDFKTEVVSVIRELHTIRVNHVVFFPNNLCTGHCSDLCGNPGIIDLVARVVQEYTVTHVGSVTVAPGVSIGFGVIDTLFHAVAIDERNLELSVAVDDIAVGGVACGGMSANGGAVTHGMQRQVVVSIVVGILVVVMAGERRNCRQFIYSFFSRDRIGLGSSGAI